MVLSNVVKVISLIIVFVYQPTGYNCLCSVTAENNLTLSEMQY